MREVWPILPEELIPNFGEEWLLNLLDLHSSEVCDMIIMLIWRIRNLRNELVHGKEIPSMVASKNFLCSYSSSVCNMKHLSVEQIIKGKFTIEEVAMVNVVMPPPAPPWTPPPADWLALSVDGSFFPEDGSTEAGMIFWNSTGEMIFASCQLLFYCNGAFEAEIHAILGGMSLCLQWSTLPILVQSNLKGALSTMSDVSLVKLLYGHLVKEIKGLMREREFVPVKIAKSQYRFQIVSLTMHLRLMAPLLVAPTPPPPRQFMILFSRL